MFDAATLVAVAGAFLLAGTVKGVGGVGTLRCKLRVEFQRRLLYCHIRDSRTARKLGAALYQDVVIKGTAKWLKSSWRIYDFEIHGVSQPRAGNLLEAMDELRAAGGSGWDDVADPMAFLEELRGGG